MTLESNRHFIALWSCLAFFLFGFQSSASAKCQTSKIVALPAAHTGATDPVAQKVVFDGEAAGQFNVWNGPLVRLNGSPIHEDPRYSAGNFVNWSAGSVDNIPQDALKFGVDFYCLSGDRGAPSSVYSVDYAFSPGSDSGFIYLPGRADPRYISNSSTIMHGVEGSWFQSTPKWESVVRPVLDRVQHH